MNISPGPAGRNHECPSRLGHHAAGAFPGHVYPRAYQRAKSIYAATASATYRISISSSSIARCSSSASASLLATVGRAPPQQTLFFRGDGGSVRHLPSAPSARAPSARVPEKGALSRSPVCPTVSASSAQARRPRPTFVKCNNRDPFTRHFATLFLET